MTKQEKYDQLYLDLAKRISEMSFAERKKVGAVLVKNNNIISFGWNGTPSGFSNSCEVDGKTIPEVIHAEANVYSKCSKDGISSKDSTIYLTLSPCYECAKLIVQSGTKRVVFLEQYVDDNPIQFLKYANVDIEKFAINNNVIFDKETHEK